MKKLSPHFVNISLSNEAGEILVLKYQLFENSLLPRWLELMREALNDPHIRIEDGGHFYVKALHSEASLESKLNRCIDIVNEHFTNLNIPEKKISLRAKAPMSVKFLNDLHTSFEILEPDPDANRYPHINKILQEMNIAIHQAEMFAMEDICNDHAQILLVPPVKKPFLDEDYDLFDCDYEFGTMYLTYGMTGVPTKDAFIHKTTPTPQKVYSSGMYLCFFDRSFKQQEELNRWLIGQNLDPKDPKLAIGYLPLGKIVSPEIGNNKSFTKALAGFNKAVKVELIHETSLVKEAVKESVKEDVKNALVPARWPFDVEIFYHLDYCPYIDLDIKFNAAELLEEAKRALSYFVVHRDYDQSSHDEKAKWRSLGLRSLFGDYTKTQYHTSYEFVGDPLYKQTVFAELCPNTMAFLNRITDVNQCERVRFMLLEPGASIKVHRDSQTRDTCLAVNISLNMPEGCVFHAGLNADGTQNEYTKILPFKDSGSVLLFNNAKYHTVVNNSDTPRIHIIFHGPIRFSDEDLLAQARLQNKIFTKKQLVKKLIEKKALVGEGFDKSPHLLNDWINAGLDWDSIPRSIQLCIWDHEKFHNEEKKKSLDLITKASFFPFDIKIIKEAQIAKAIEDAIKENKTHLVLMAAGNFLEVLNEHIFAVVQFCQKMSAEKTVVAGHILDDQLTKNLPYFHEQYLIINLKEWAKVPDLDLGPIHTTEMIDFPAYNRSTEQFHDHYTPHWLAPGNDIAPRKGFAHWGTKVIKYLLGRGKDIVNIPHEVRHRRSYAYPRDNNQKAWDQIQSKIQDRLNFAKNEVYAFNNENLNIAVYETIKPNTLISVCSGFKAFKILEQYEMIDKDKFYFIDFSQNSLSFYKELLTANTQADLLRITTHYSEAKHKEKSHEICKHQLSSTLRENFDSNPERLLKAIKTASKGQVEFANLILNPETLADKLSSDSRFVIWISNVFYNTTLYFLISEKEARERFEVAVVAIAKKVKAKAFLQKNSRTIIFGNDIFNPIGVITDGGMQSVSKNKDDWQEILIS